MSGKRGCVFQGWCSNRDGTTAIEFSLLSIPYFTMILAIIEMSLMFTAATLVEGGTSVAARQIRTGQIQQASEDVGQQMQMFRDSFCGHSGFFVNCNNVVIEAINLETFGSFAVFAEPQFDEEGNLIPQGFDLGGSSDVVLIRVAYRYDLMTPFIGNLLGQGGTNSRTFLSTIIQQSEPYDPQELLESEDFNS